MADILAKVKVKPDLEPTCNSEYYHKILNTSMDNSTVSAEHFLLFLFKATF